VTAGLTHRLEGLEADNLVAFLALLGLLRSLEASDRRRAREASLRPRISWDLNRGPLRPVLHVVHPATQEEVAHAAAEGIDILLKDHDFPGHQSIDFTRSESRAVLKEAMSTATAEDRGRVDLLAALMSDAAVKTGKGEQAYDPPVDPTPLCLMFGQGHQFFLERLATVPALPAPKGSRRKVRAPSATDCLMDALFKPWERKDATFSFRWDAEEDVRYALMAGDPTDSAFKVGTQHGANRLAAVGLAVLAVAPRARGVRVRPAVLGGLHTKQGFAIAWPVWRDPATLTAIQGLLGHPGLWQSGGLRHLGVPYVFEARRISVGKYMNIGRAELRA